MAIIDKQSLSVFGNADDLISYVALHRYEPENANFYESDHFADLPENWADVVRIMDFEMLFNSYGLFSYLENKPGLYLHETIDSFNRTGNTIIAQTLTKASNLLKDHEVTPEQLYAQAKERAEKEEEYENIRKKSEEEMPEFEAEINYPELRETILNLEEEMAEIMEDCDYWENVKNNLK